MLNKNDPLIGAVQEVMKKNQAERNAAKLVNEKFGVHDRKALPHEKQGEWDAAYKAVLTESLHPNQQNLDVHEPEKDKLTAQDFKMLRAKKKPMEEATDGDTTSPSSMGIKKPDYAPAGTTPDYAKPKEQTVNRAAKTSLPPGTMKEEMTDAQMKKREEIVKSMKKKMAGFKERYGKRAKDVMYATATKQAMKEDNEGFNNRHGMSVTASAEKQAVADQLNERVVDNRQRKSRLAPVYTQGIKQTQARLAREPAEPPRSIGQKLRDVAGGAEAAITGAADRFTDFGQSAIGMRPLSDYARIAQDVTAGNVARLARGESPRGYSSSAAALDKYKRNLSQKYPTLTRAGQEAGDIASNVAAVTSVPGLVKGGLKAGAKYLARKKADDVVQSTTKLLSAPKTAKPVSQAAREPASVVQAAKVTPKKAKPVSQVAREPDEIIPPKKPTSQTGNAGIRGTFQDKLARARQNAGSDLKARQLPALRRTTEPTNYVRPGVPAVRPTTSTAVARSGMPNLAAGGATRVVGLSNKAKAGLAASSAAGLAGYAAYKNMGDAKPAVSAVSAKTSAGPSFEKTGRGTAPSLSSNAEKIKTSTQTTTTQPDYDKMTFSQAFKTARQQAGGASGKFKYKGKEYQTNIQGTSTAKKPQEKYQAASKLKTVAPAPVTKTTTSVMGGQGIAAIPGGASKLAAKPALTSATNNTRRVGPDGQGGLTVGQNKPMGMSFTPKTTVDTVKKPAASVTPQMSQSVSSLQQKSSMAGKERGLAPDFAKRELTRRQNIQTVKGA